MPDSVGSPSQAASPDVAESEQPSLYGVWQGRIAHADGDLDVTLEIADGDETTITLADQPERSLGDLAIGDRGLSGRVTTDLPTRPDYQRPVLLELRLERDGARLVGVAIAHGTGRFALSHWIELETQAGAKP